MAALISLIGGGLIQSVVVILFESSGRSNTGQLKVTVPLRLVRDAVVR